MASSISTGVEFNISSENSNVSAPKNIILNTNKAGMEGLDTGRINNIIQKASEGSRFFKHKQKCQEKLDLKISLLLQAKNALSMEQIENADAEMEAVGKRLIHQQDTNHCIVHVDMDMFYAAVEMRDDPSLRTKPMAVGSTAMLSTSNYVARKFGVRAAMPGFIAKKLCPELIIVPVNFNKYKEVSKEVQEIFSMYDPSFSPMSLDEAYLDITNYISMHGGEYTPECEGISSAELVVQELRRKIEEKTLLTASAGISFNTMLSKVCSDLNKPNGQYYLPYDKAKVNVFIQKLPIRKVSGIGSVSEQHLKALDIDTCGDVWQKKGLLKLLFSETSCMYYLRVSLGVGWTEVSSHSEKDRKSISTETTFQTTSNKSEFLQICSDLCKELSADMKKHNILGKVFTLKFKTSDFETRTRAHTVMEATDDGTVMFSTAKRLLINEFNICNGQLSLRLIGVKMSSLVERGESNSKRQSTLSQMFSKILKDDEDRNNSVDSIYNTASNNTTLKDSLHLNITDKRSFKYNNRSEDNGCGSSDKFSKENEEWHSMFPKNIMDKDIVSKCLGKESISKSATQNDIIGDLCDLENDLSSNEDENFDNCIFECPNCLKDFSNMQCFEKHIAYCKICKGNTSIVNSPFAGNSSRSLKLAKKNPDLNISFHNSYQFAGKLVDDDPTLCVYKNYESRQLNVSSEGTDASPPRNDQDFSKSFFKAVGHAKRETHAHALTHSAANPRGTDSLSFDEIERTNNKNHLESSQFKFCSEDTEASLLKNEPTINKSFFKAMGHAKRKQSTMTANLSTIDRLVTVNRICPDEKGDYFANGDVLSRGSESFQCPICNNKRCTDISTLNSHMDVCLNVDIVRKLVKESHDNGNQSNPSASRLNRNDLNENKMGNRPKSRRKHSSEKPNAKKAKLGSSDVLHKFLGL